MFFCDNQKALSEAHNQQVPSLFLHLSIPEFSSEFTNPSFCGITGPLPKLRLNTSFWWPFLLRGSLAFKSNLRRVWEIYDKFIIGGNSPLFSVKNVPTLELPTIYEKIQWVNRVEFTDLKMFSVHRKLALLEHVVDLRLDGNSLCYVSNFSIDAKAFRYRNVLPQECHS